MYEYINVTAKWILNFTDNWQYKPSTGAILRNIGSRSWQYGPNVARSAQKAIEGQYSQYGSS